MTEIGHPPKLPLLIYGDNQSANKFGLTARWTKENRHLDVKYMVLAAECEKGFIDIKYVPSQANVADVGTKAQKCPLHFEFLVSHLCTINKASETTWTPPVDR